MDQHGAMGSTTEDSSGLLPERGCRPQSLDKRMTGSVKNGHQFGTREWCEGDFDVVSRQQGCPLFDPKALARSGPEWIGHEGKQRDPTPPLLSCPHCEVRVGGMLGLPTSGASN